MQGSENLYAAVPFSFSPRDGTWIPLIFDVSLLRHGCDAVTLESGPAAFVKYKLLLMLPSADQEAHLAGWSVKLEQDAACQILLCCRGILSPGAVSILVPLIFEAIIFKSNIIVSLRGAVLRLDSVCFLVWWLPEIIPFLAVDLKGGLFQWIW